VEKPESFIAYQQTQARTVSNQIEKCSYVASFFAHEKDEAAFVGLYDRRDVRFVSSRELKQMPEHQELLKHGLIT